MVLWRLFPAVTVVLFVTGLVVQLRTPPNSARMMAAPEGHDVDGSIGSMSALVSQTLLHGAPFTQFQLGRVYRDYVNVHKCGAGLPPPALPASPALHQEHAVNASAPKIFRLESLVTTRATGPVSVVLCVQLPQLNKMMARAMTEDVVLAETKAMLESFNRVRRPNDFVVIFHATLSADALRLIANMSAAVVLQRVSLDEKQAAPLSVYDLRAQLLREVLETDLARMFDQRVDLVMLSDLDVEMFQNPFAHLRSPACAGTRFLANNIGPWDLQTGGKYDTNVELMRFLVTECNLEVEQRPEHKVRTCFGEKIESTYNYPLVADPRDVLWFLRIKEALLKTTLKFHFTCAQYAMTHILSYVAPLVCFDGFFFRAPRTSAGLVVLHKLPHQ